MYATNLHAHRHKLFSQFVALRQDINGVVLHTASLALSYHYHIIIIITIIHQQRCTILPPPPHTHKHVQLLCQQVKEEN